MYNVQENMLLFSKGRVPHMNRYKFEITANGFLLRTYFSENEANGIKWCRTYCSQFQRKVANVEIKLVIYSRTKRNHIWEYSGKPFIYDRTLTKKPLIRKSENQDKI